MNKFNKKFILILTLPAIFSINAKLDEKKAFEYDSYLRTQGEVISIFEGRYFKELSPKEVMFNAIKGLVDNLDPHTTVLDVSDAKKLGEQMGGEFSGIGGVFPIDNKKEEESITLIELVYGGPADKAGLRPGDKIIQINNELIRGLEIDEIMAQLKGPKGTQVSVKVLRENQTEPLNFTIIRDIIKEETALMYYFPEHKVYYLLLSIFSEKSAENVKLFMEKALKDKGNAVIIDLRNNTGGLFDSAIEIASYFLPKNTEVVSIKDRNDKTTGTWTTNKQPLKIPQGFPIFFIVNNYTASAAEILAGTLQIQAQKKNNPFVFIVGTETFGKGSVQEVIPISNDFALKLTTGLYCLPYNTGVQGKGVYPDFPLEYRTPPTETMRWMTTNYGKESGLKGHIKPDKNTTKEELEKKDAEKPWKEKRKEILSNDYFVQNTLNLIGLLLMGSSCNPDLLKKRETALKFLKAHYIIDIKINIQELSI